MTQGVLFGVTLASCASQPVFGRHCIYFIAANVTAVTSTHMLCLGSIWPPLRLGLSIRLQLSQAALDVGIHTFHCLSVPVSLTQLKCCVQIHVILFGIGEGEPEGIYSLRAMPGADQLPQETIIAFEDAEDAQRYASRLEATMDRPPNVVPITPSELLEFCLESGYNCRLEQGGSVLSPPDFNVDVTDWERSLRLR